MLQNHASKLNIYLLVNLKTTNKYSETLNATNFLGYATEILN